MHAVAYSVVGRFAGATVATSRCWSPITASLLLSWLLMVSQAMESMTRAFYARADLDLILASPVAVHRLVRRAYRDRGAVGRADGVAARGRRSSICWSCAAAGAGSAPTAVIAAMGAAAAAFAVVLTVALFHVLRAEAHAARRAGRGRRRRRRLCHRRCRSRRSSPTVPCRAATCCSRQPCWRSRPISAAFCGGRRAPCSATARRSRRCCSPRAVLLAGADRDRRPALRRLHDGRGRRCRLRGAPCAHSGRLSPNLAARARCAARNGCCCGATPGSCRRR